MTFPSVFSLLRWRGIFLATLCASLVGCGANLPSTGSLAGGQLRGLLHGGQQPIVGASVQLYAAGTTGYGSAATALLASPVITDATGSFTITGGYRCPSSTSQLYIVATGGNPGLSPGTNNAAIALMAALGPCSLHGGQYTLDPNSFITINEVTTVASVYALAAFMGGDAAHVGTSSTNAVGLANSFALVNNLVNTTTGAALTVTPAGNGTVPQATINTLGNIVASCVNSTGTTGPCIALAAAATPSGGTAPTNTIQGILNVARNPVNNVGALFGLASPTPPFQPTLAVAPNDWVMAVTYSGGGLSGIGAGVGSIGEGLIAIDAMGDVWIPNPSSVTELSSNGAVLSGTAGYTGGGLNAAVGLAIDPSGNAWVAGAGNVVKLSSSGSILSGANGYTGGGLNMPEAIALDGQGNAWVSDFGSNSVIKLDNNGNILSGASGFSPGAGTSPQGLGIDRAGNVWMGTGSSSMAVAEFNNSGIVISGSGYPVTNLVPQIVAFDGSGNAWTNGRCCYGIAAQYGLNNIAKLSSSGSELSPAGGYTNCVSPGIVGDLNIICLYWAPNPFALDGAGNVWSAAVLLTSVNGRVPNPMISGTVAEMSNTGTILSGAKGYTGGTTLGLLFSPVGPSGPGTVPQSIAIDGGGNVWVLLSGPSVVEFIGAATPVVTPFSLGVKNGTLGSRP